MKKLFLLCVMTAAAWVTLPGTGSAQPGKMPECGLGMNKDHSCHCIRHVEQVQEQHMTDCERAKLGTAATPGEIAKACLATMPTHCDVVEHYGNWFTDEEGGHPYPMPDQCSTACLRAHCKCSDGPTCHFAHDPKDDPKE